MPAANTDKFKKAKRKFSTTIGVGGFAAAATTLPLSSTSGLDTDTAITLVIEPGAVNEEVITGVASGSNIINCVRGKEGTTDSTHNAGAAVSMYFTETHWDDAMDGILVSYDQDGTLKAGAVDNAAVLASNVVTTAKILDANVTAAKIAFGGAGVGVWWEEIGRTTLSVAADVITVSSIPARKYLNIIVKCINSGQISQTLTFNGDAGNNYASTISTAGAADALVTLATGLAITGAASYPMYFTLHINNATAQEKIGNLVRGHQNTASAAFAPTHQEGIIKWANTAAQISTVTLTNGGTGDYAIGSEIVILGHD